MNEPVITDSLRRLLLLTVAIVVAMVFLGTQRRASQTPPSNSERAAVDAIRPATNAPPSMPPPAECDPVPGPGRFADSVAPLRARDTAHAKIRVFDD